ncbi:homoserine O-acetyltransferase/O-succinyltransferase [Geosmithia morbida]|uniref:Homoserine O-acetyltransferase/O-succinyltransferase n=1 Tax=Geosmithia morbida TaxID=1094350 RepID=A0A9P4YZP6_9HYPO|nr:homoserine O-acetyltransferase/O-succinyltransferase [Geosmithia morbida]KAF4124734.1 homoserine O-acetyltransferase/O-succinyltransferase [Geosmithia morbida]
MDDTIKYHELRDFSFGDGTTLPTVRLAYLDLNPGASKNALVTTCFRGRLRGTSAFNTGALRNYHVVVVALFGNGESSSPSNTPGFPSSIDYRDCVRAERQLLSHLGIDSLDVVMGFSMGGQTAYYWSIMYPEQVKNAVIICSAARTSRHNYQFLEGPKAALTNAVDYVNRDLAPASPSPSRAVHAFGKAYSAWLTSAEWFDQEGYKTLGFNTLSDWDHVTCLAGYKGWHPDDLLAKLHMWQRGDITPVDPAGDGSLETSLSHIKARVLLLPSRTDQYFRWEASEKESKSIPNVMFKVIPSIWGHLAGLGINPTDSEFIDGAISEFLSAS